MIVSTATAVVFVVGRRRYLTKGGAYAGAAKAKIRERCERNHDCTPYEDDTGAGGACDRHCDPYYGRLVRRLARFYRYLDRVEAKRALHEREVKAA